MKRKTTADRVVALACALSMILTIFVGVPLPTFAQTDTTTMQSKNNLSVNDGTYTIINDGQWGTLVLGESTSWEVTMDMKNAASSAEFGLQICGADDNADGVLLEGDDSFLQVFLIGCDVIRLIGCDNGWGNVPGYQWDNINRFTGYGAQDDLTLTVKLNGNQLDYFVDGTQCGETIILDDSVMYGNVVTLFMKHTDTSISNVTFKGNTCSVHTYGDEWLFSSANHWRKCTKCGSAVDEAAHTYSSDTDEICDVCEKETRHVNHVPSSGWSWNKDNHWQNCTKCDNKFDFGEHTYDSDGVCTVCGVKTANDSEIKTIYAYGATDGNASWEAGDIATVTKKYFAVSFTMNAAKYGGIIAETGCCGLMFGDNDDTCIFIPYDGGNTDTQRIIGIFGSAQVVFGKWWGTSDFGSSYFVDISEYVNKDVTILVLGEKNDDGTTTLTAYINGKQVNVWGNQEAATAAFNGRLQWALRLNGSSAVCKFTESDDIILATVFDKKCEHTYGDEWLFSSANHWRKCTKCGSAVDEAAHTYSSDTDEICDVCEKETRHVNHVLSSGWSWNKDNHWQNCTKCDNKFDFGEHTYDSDGVCTVCGVKASFVVKDGIKTIYAYGATDGNASWEAGDIATVTKKYFAVSFTMNAAKYGGISADNGCCGLMFGDNDDTCIFIPYDGSRNDTQLGIGIWGGANVVFGKWWGLSDFGAQQRTNIDEFVDKDVTILVLGEKNDDGTTTLTAYINGKQVNVWGNQEAATAAFNGRLQWALRLNGSSAVCKFTESDDIILATVFDKKCEHTYGDWNANADGHFRTCTKCKDSDSGAHVYDGELFYDSGTHYRICTVCSMYMFGNEHDLKMRIDQIAHQSYCTECPYVSELTEHTWGDDGCCSFCGSKKPANPMGFCGADGSNLTWELDLEIGLLTINGRGEMGDTLPWRDYADSIKTVEIGEGVTSIADGAFMWQFTALETVILPKSLEKIGENAFNGCVNLTFAGSVQKTVFALFSRARVIEPDTSLKVIGKGAFSGCVKLQNFDIPTELEILGDMAFQNCKSIESVVVPKTTVYGGDSIFSGCTSLKNVEFAEETGISINMFSDCTSLETIELPSDIKSIPTGAFNRCTSLREIDLPDTVEQISKDAFNGCASLESIELPETLKKVEDGAFSECTSLEKIVVNGKDTEFENTSATIPENSVIYCAPDAKVLEYATENVREVVIDEHEHSNGTYEHNSDKHWYTCTDCGNPYNVAAHVYDDACDDDCNICGRVREPLHDWSNVWSSDADSHWHECALCGQKKDVAKHVFGDDGECECGQLPFIYGDANGDGKVSSADIIVIKKYIANYDKATDTSTIDVFTGADANGDGKINSSDVILLKKYIANLDRDGNSSIVLGKG